MKEIKFNTRTEYLTEKNLGEFLSILFEGEEIIYNKNVKELGFRPDYYLPGRKLIVEFDGHHHYTNNNTVIRDTYKDKLAEEKGITVIRIPYFIQLEMDVIYMFFDKKCKGEFKILNDFSTYPHGFIDDKVFLPGTFSSLGIKKYKEFIRNSHSSCMEEHIEVEIVVSLINKILLGEARFFDCFPYTDLRNLNHNLFLFDHIYRRHGFLESFGEPDYTVIQRDVELMKDEKEPDLPVDFYPSPFPLT